MRRLLALVDDLEENLPRERLVALHVMRERLRIGIEEAFTNHRTAPKQWRWTARDWGWGASPTSR